MSYWRRISPRSALADLWNEWRRPNPHRWYVLALSVAITSTMMIVLIPDSTRVPPARPDVTFITTFDPDRSLEEIVASNLENQRRQDELAALRAARDEERRERARALGRATGIDVDALERGMVRRIAQQDAAAAARQQPTEQDGATAPEAGPQGE